MPTSTTVRTDRIGVVEEKEFCETKPINYLLSMNVTCSCAGKRKIEVLGQIVGKREVIRFPPVCP
jgi:hypothetical protein